LYGFPRTFILLEVDGATDQLASQMPRADNFSAKTKDLLSRRVAMRCSNPNCRQTTSGPTSDPTKAMSIGVAAHISAASKGGPRFNGSLTSAERQSPDNAIWLCQSCAKLIDSDVERYSEYLLNQWKRLSEEAARLAIDSPNTNPSLVTDVDILKHFSACFDRPAFQDPFHEEGSMEAFDKAIEDTITAINTGALRARDGAILASGRGKAYLTNPRWRAQMDTVVDLLRAIRSRYRLALALRQIETHERGDGTEWYCVRDPDVAAWMDVTRSEIISLFADIASEAGIHSPRSPRALGRLRDEWNR
jgi:hypothetical protein